MQKKLFTFFDAHAEHIVLFIIHTNNCTNIYRVIHKSVKHLKNSQQIHYSTDHDSSYVDRERNSPSFFFLVTYFTDAQCVHLW